MASKTQAKAKPKTPPVAEESGGGSTAPVSVKAAEEKGPEPFETMYWRWPAVAVPDEVTLSRKADTNEQLWYYKAGLCGTKQPVLRITYQGPEHDEGQVVLVYDGDGSGTLKFKDNGGSPLYGHMEVAAT